MSKGRPICLWLIFLGIFVLCCGFCGYNLYRGQIPSAPLPSAATLIYHSPSDKQYWSASRAYWYYEKYIIEMSKDEVVTFYRSKARTCAEVTISDIPDIPVPFTRCYLKAEPFGNVRVEIYIENSQTQILVEVRWNPPPIGTPL